MKILNRSFLKRKKLKLDKNENKMRLFLFMGSSLTSLLLQLLD